MYLLDTLYYIYKPIKRKDLMAVSKRVAEENHIFRIKIMADMIFSSVKYGCMWTEYGDLDFYYRDSKNRNTFITTFFNFKLYDRVNLKSKRNIFHEKILFLQEFKPFIKRDWIDIAVEPMEKIKEFLIMHPTVVAKESYGDSGKEVEIINVSDFSDLDDVLKYIHDHNLNLLEEKIVNHPVVEKLNPSSLNTIRIVTVKNQAQVHILFAGIRVGGRGAKIDNISQGGKVARIDIKTGKINSRFYYKQSSYISDGGRSEDISGYQLPHWDKVIDSVKKAATIVPEISIVAWDVAITNKGIDFVEGNESFGSVIMQLYYGHNEEGLKPQLLKMLRG